MKSQADLHKILDQNQITDVIDMTNACYCEDREEEHGKLADLPESVRLYTPIFTTPLDILSFKASRQSL